MTRRIQNGFLLAALLAAGAPLWAQKENKQPKMNAVPRSAPPAKVPPKAFPKGEMPKGGGGGPRLNNPANQFERLIAMPPEKRDQVLERLPPAQQTRLRERLDKWDHLPPQQKAFQLELLNRYAALPPERQDSYLKQIQAVNNLDQPRRREVILELRQLWRLNDAQRQQRLSSDDYKARFSPSELQMLQEISATNPLPR
jgi:hypothetical protein